MRRLEAHHRRSAVVLEALPPDLHVEGLIVQCKEALALSTMGGINCGLLFTNFIVSVSANFKLAICILIHVGHSQASQIWIVRNLIVFRAAITFQASLLSGDSNVYLLGQCNRFSRSSSKTYNCTHVWRPLGLRFVFAKLVS